jgi:methylated-DNA-protein-cysteine methyltransferase-like protein
LNRTHHPSELFEEVLLAIESIPEGCVATYGQIAGIVGTGPRQVAQALRSCPDGRSVPWFRVINSAGKVSEHLSKDRQRELLEQEGIGLENDRVDLEVYGWSEDGE